ncbi:hypothetical protein CO180_04585 [candidate division WWE3 bacterium CG_4_9_14_3_um_filter_41_6]|uniref:LOG family protein n=1 Tax=candidate division WWE3 bacterium CG_4_10_14_0_2_um_filter_41_14 TaxID=1975072 RepID=A0A2M7TK50_UNCKA|nr:MAG: hypothetical protein COY32_02240 [candidate division WWE3 bacterium CG_4_10_14_0_2_um_filter_41_14]PJA37950.1 MAG: hypothetical protein CO180_04585 [candidate division WWE3 bacterium CG_4_9_14_3_um_filter_41_6]
MKQTPIKKVCFFGHANTPEDHVEYLDTVESARLLAQAGYTIVNGGGPGIMKAATVGAHKGGGKAIGVTLYPDGSDELVSFEGRDTENTFDEEVVTTTYVARTLKLIELGDIFVTMNGGTGTVSEFGMTWGLARLHFGQHEDLILYGSWWHEIMEAFAKNMHIREEALKVYHIVDTPADVLDMINNINHQRGF